MVRQLLVVSAIATFSSPSLAAQTLDVECLFDNDGARVEVMFAIDTTQFAPPLNANDPPRRAVTEVVTLTGTFTAEPFFAAGDAMGFFTPDQTHSLMVRPEGQATYVSGEGPLLFGTCQVTP